MLGVARGVVKQRLDTLMNLEILYARMLANALQIIKEKSTIEREFGLVKSK